MAETAEDRRYMAAALRLSLWHSGDTDTNPSVGCLIVKDGAIVGDAVTARGGRPHAETQALAVAGEQARGATAYVTLEPCSHYGRTPPCANALVAAGISRLVCCLPDPDPRVSGRGLSILRDAGIEVELGVLEAEGRRVLAPYLTRQIKGRPHVTLKLAVSADGMLGRRGEEVSITGPLSRAQVHALRAVTDSILVGIGTVLADDPELTVRLAGREKHSPIRIVLDHRLQLPLSSKLVTGARDVPVMVAVVSTSGDTSASGLQTISPASGETDEALSHSASCDCGEHSDADLEKQTSAQPFSPLAEEMPGGAEGEFLSDIVNRARALEAAGVEVIETLNLEVLLAILAARGNSSLLVEGGATVARAFLDASLVDRIILFQGPGIIGKDGLESPLTPSDIPTGFTLVRAESFGPDRCFEYERSS